MDKKLQQHSSNSSSSNNKWSNKFDKRPHC